MKIGIVNDSHLAVVALRRVIALDPALEVTWVAEDGESAVRMAAARTPDLILMDLLMPVMDGIAATAAIRRELPETEVLALTSVLEDASVVGAVRAGAIGYLLKDTQAEALCQAIKAAAAGQVQLTPKAAARLMQAVSTPESPEALTERETEVLRLLAQGQSNKQIAHSLHNTEQTIKTHVSKILSKLGVQSRTQATLYAIRVGLVSAGSSDTTG